MSGFLISYSTKVLLQLASSTAITTMEDAATLLFLKQSFYIQLTFFSCSGEAAVNIVCVVKHNSNLLTLQSQADKTEQRARSSIGGVCVWSTQLSTTATWLS